MKIKFTKSGSPQRERPTTHYSVLGVPPASPLEKIKDVYHRLARMNHPDLHPGDAEAEERFKAMALAWGVLRDEGLRRKYDAQLLLEGRFSCPKCGGKGLHNRFVRGKLEKDVLCDHCDGTGEEK